MTTEDRLLNRERLFAEHPIRIDDDTEARQEVEQARLVLNLLRAQGDADETALKQAQEALIQARSTLRACYEWIPLRAMEADEFEALMGKHKPRPETDDTLFNRETFPRACLLACDESGRSEADWDHIWKRVLSKPERTELCNTAIRVNARTPDESLPKGWAQIEPSL
ncbi:hypothetical protein ACFWYW_55885 [Nonomuraea sp. NPDC059023]|uniref:hypothetical protein n=1 Tax=unclassified Nonomuraea TaxID=2593643 RepID=UPI003676C5BF